MPPLLHDAAFGAAQRMKDDERLSIELPRDRLDLSDLEPRHDAVQNLALDAAHAAVPLVYRHPAPELAGDPIADRPMLARHDRNGRVLVDAVEHEVERLGR